MLPMGVALNFSEATLIKFIHFLKQCCSVYENKVLQLMSAWLSLFCESTLFSQTEDRAMDFGVRMFLKKKVLLLFLFS